MPKAAKRYLSSIALTLSGLTLVSTALAQDVAETNSAFTINKVLV